MFVSDKNLAHNKTTTTKKVSINRWLASKQQYEHKVFEGRLLHFFLQSNESNINHESNINQSPFCSGAPDHDDIQVLYR